MAGTDGLVDALIFKLAVQQVKDYAMFVLDPAGRIMTWNLGAQRIKGYAPEEIIGRHFSVFYTPDAVARGWPAEELRLATARGALRGRGLARAQGRLALLGERRDHGAARRRRQAARLLQDHARSHRAQAPGRSAAPGEERFRLLVDGVDDYAIFMLDPDGVVTSWNAGAQRIKGYAPRRDHRPALLPFLRGRGHRGRQALGGARHRAARRAAPRTRAGA